MFVWKSTEIKKWRLSLMVGSTFSPRHGWFSLNVLPVIEVNVDVNEFGHSHVLWFAWLFWNVGVGVEKDNVPRELL